MEDSHTLRYPHGFALPSAPLAYVARQVHAASVLELRGDEDTEWARQQAADALITRAPGVSVAVFTADCVPVLLEDAVQGACAAIHAGWRGLVAGVIANTVSALGGNPATMRAAIGPCIGPCCFEVGPEVAELFPGFVHTGKSRPHVDLRAAARAALRQARVGHIAHSEVPCTFCSPAGYPSFRRDGSTPRRLVHRISVPAVDAAARPL